MKKCPTKILNNITINNNKQSNKVKNFFQFINT